MLYVIFSSFAKAFAKQDLFPPKLDFGRRF